MARFAFLTALLASTITGTQAHPQPRDVTRNAACGSEPPAGFVETAAVFGSFEAAARANGTEENARLATVTIDTYFHVVARTTALSGGYIPASQLTAQLSAMNSHYGKLYIHSI